ncbi:dTDP-4-dehydrorhamnose reductase [Filimonas zeae]|uniref:dTDP-4-dehydrorhamnose reductase n=1 Tax=Filimonas zeae TaxID=1737353 RepID=A0A917MUV4_9BACT|nr:NAD(P)-dependent oxidoreductase [Filimonas zeae]MDR6339009.1 dTDP-4-dehydrorhamnose reductase [Filimonas zeae]GGH65539.1 NAD(P)-dependent oxidoreductase [Filimonas zeae]
MNILIIGGSGLVGGNLYRELQKQPFVQKLLATHISFPVPETVFLDPLVNMSPEISAAPWDVIVHTGALTHVDRCEQDKELSYALTVQSTLNLLQLAATSNALFVYLGTDYIFNGENGPYAEDDAVDPLSVYGLHKLEAETAVRQYKRHLVARITNVYGAEVRNKNFIAAMLQRLKQEERPEVKAPYDQYATPVNAADIARALVLLIRDGAEGVYHLGGTDYVSRTQLLQRINVYYNNRIHIQAVSTAALGQAAKRPLRGGLLSGRFMAAYPHFTFTNIDDYLKHT